MLGIGNSTNYGSTVKQALYSLGFKKPEVRYTDGPFKVPVIDLTPEYLERSSAARERSKQKSETNERWTRNSLYKTDLDSILGYTINKDALNKVRDRLIEEGKKTNRTPTHEITDEQFAILAEKYDLEYLSCFAGMEDVEYGNFLLDLVYMNVFSLDEMPELFGVSDVNVYTKAVAYVWPSDGSKGYYQISNCDKNFDSWEDILKYINKEYLKIKYPNRTESYYDQMTEDYMDRSSKRISVIQNFFDRVYEHYNYDLINIVKPNIEDASEKLKEDFGKALA